MSDSLDTLKQDLLSSVQNASDLTSLDEARVAALGKKGKITAMMKDMGSLSPDERKTRGQAMNAIKQAVSDAIDARKAELGRAAMTARLEQERIDVSLPVRPQAKGFIHPLSQVVDEVVQIFGAMGFEVAEGPDIEDDWHNFEALNFPPLVALTPAAAPPRAPSTSALSKALPPNVKLVTLTSNYAEINGGSLLLRLSHLYEVGEHPTLSQPATFSLAAVFAKAGLKVTAAEETMLTANQPRKAFEARKKVWVRGW